MHAVTAHAQVSVPMNDLNEATLLSGLRLTRLDGELSLLDIHTWQGGTDACLIRVGLYFNCHGGMGSLFGVCCQQTQRNIIFVMVFPCGPLTICLVCVCA